MLDSSSSATASPPEEERASEVGDEVLANCLLAGGTTPLNVFAVLPTLAARGEKAKALADVAARATRATFFVMEIMVYGRDSCVDASSIGQLLVVSNCTPSL